MTSCQIEQKSLQICYLKTVFLWFYAFKNSDIFTCSWCKVKYARPPKNCTLLTFWMKWEFKTSQVLFIRCSLCLCSTTRRPRFGDTKNIQLDVFFYQSKVCQPWATDGPRLSSWARSICEPYVTKHISMLFLALSHEDLNFCTKTIFVNAMRLMKCDLPFYIKAATCKSLIFTKITKFLLWFYQKSVTKSSQAQNCFNRFLFSLISNQKREKGLIGRGFILSSQMISLVTDSFFLHFLVAFDSNGGWRF